MLNPVRVKASRRSLYLAVAGPNAYRDLVSHFRAATRREERPVENMLVQIIGNAPMSPDSTNRCRGPGFDVKEMPS